MTDCLLSTFKKIKYEINKRETLERFFIIFFNSTVYKSG